MMNDAIDRFHILTTAISIVSIISGNFLTFVSLEDFELNKQEYKAINSLIIATLAMIILFTCLHLSLYRLRVKELQKETLIISQ